MNKNEQQYLDLLKLVLENGVDQKDRTGVGTRKLVGEQLKYDLSENFPLWTTRKLLLKTASSELLWMLEGSSDERRLAELRWEKPRNEIASKQTIWTANAQAPYWTDKAKFSGDLGEVYGRQWRHWIDQRGNKIDQIQQVINSIKSDPYGRRHIVSAWNPGELSNMALPPCHIIFTFSVRNDKLDCILHQRSNDLFLGTATNVPFYSLLTHLVAHETNLTPGYFIHQMTDCHIYHNHFDAVTEQLARTPNEGPQISINFKDSIFDYNVSDFSLINYNPHPSISAPMAV